MMGHGFHLFSLAVSADARVNVLETLELELGLILGGSGLFHLNEFDSFLVGFSFLGLWHSLSLLLLLT
jgi:hypothetical protein